MTYEAIEYSVSDKVATITLNRPDVLNGLSDQMRAEILDAVREAPKEAKVVVVTGKGRGFCAGQDLGGAKDVTQIDLEGILRDEYEPMLRAIYDCPLPVISAVNGPAAGAGANLALAADVVIAKESAYFLQAFAPIGLIPDAGGTYFLPRNMGLAKAMGAAMFADKISAKQASDWGMIWEAVPDDAFDETVAKRAATIANGPSEAFRRIKKTLRASLENSLDDQLKMEARVQGKLGKSHDFQEGVLAFLEKRKPKFEGR